MVVITEKGFGRLFDTLRRQGYHIIGNHSAVKRCKWYKESILDREPCYKSKFYGIKSHQCMQSTPCLQFCTQECVFCWRVQAKDLGLSEKNEIPEKEFRWDKPELVLDGLLKEQIKFAQGYRGNPKANQKKVEEAFHPKLLTLSLAGEPTIYPHLSKLIKLAKEKDLLTFLVSNGTLPESLKRLEKEHALPTQLYISMDASDESVYNKTCRPTQDGLWKNYQRTLEFIRSIKKKTRTVLRMTLVRNYNDNNWEGYARQIRKAEPDYVEVKSFSYVGGARYTNRGLSLGDMLRMKEIKKIAEKLSRLTGYRYCDEHRLSRVALLVRDEAAERNRKIKY